MKISRVLLSASALTFVAFGADFALAADLPVKSKPIVAATFDWSGVYIGAHAGYGGGMKDWAPDLGADFIARGALAGGQVGINKQLGSFVFGVELSGSWADLSGRSHLEVGGPAFGNSIAVDHNSRIDGIATIVGRAGLAADRWLVFAKAGLSAAHENHSIGFVATNPAQGTFSNGNEVRYAPMLGLGTEYALTANWSLFGEYNFHYLGERTVAFRGTRVLAGAATPLAFDRRIDQSIHIAKLGVNYRWGATAIDPASAAVAPSPGTNWSGGYIGVQGGYAWGGKQWPDVSGPPLVHYSTNGWLAGGTIGANAQSGNIVFGVEGEILGTGIKGSTSVAQPGAPNVTITYDSKIDWLALATARAGFAVNGNILLYSKGGVAIAQESHSLNLVQTGPAQTLSVSGEPVHTGVVAGAGAEYAFAPNWSVKAEYNYVRMFQQAATLRGTIAGAQFGTSVLALQANKIGQDLNIVKFGVNYHFSPLPVVVAKY